MSKVTVVQSLNSQPRTVWALIGSPSGFADWHPAIASSPVDDDRRTCVMPDGARIEERIVSHDDTAMSYTYQITASPLPLDNYNSRITVRPAAGGCEVEWTGDFDALAPAEEVEGMVRGLYQAGMSALKERLEA